MAEQEKNIREEGYYHVIYEGKDMIAEYQYDSWWMCGVEYNYIDASFDMIGKKIEL